MPIPICGCTFILRHGPRSLSLVYRRRNVPIDGSRPEARHRTSWRSFGCLSECHESNAAVSVPALDRSVIKIQCPGSPTMTTICRGGRTSDPVGSPSYSSHWRSLRSTRIGNRGALRSHLWPRTGCSNFATGFDHAISGMNAGFRPGRPGLIDATVALALRCPRHPLTSCNGHQIVISWLKNPNLFRTAWHGRSSMSATHQPTGP